MKTQRIIQLVCFYFLSITLAYAQSAEEKAVRAFITKAQELWNTHDIIAYNDLYTEDATLISPVGEFCANKAEIVKLHLLANEMHFKHTSITIDIQKIRFIAADVAVVNCKYNSLTEQEHTMPDGKINKKGDRNAVAILHILVKKNGVWKISATQVTSVL